MDLSTARLCINCDTITEHKHCPSCLSKETFPLARWLNRDGRSYLNQWKEKPCKSASN